MTQDEALEAAAKRFPQDDAWTADRARLAYVNLKMHMLSDDDGQPTLCWVLERRGDHGAPVDTLFVEAESGQVHKMR